MRGKPFKIPPLGSLTHMRANRLLEQTDQADGRRDICMWAWIRWFLVCVANCDLSILEEGYLLITQMCVLVTLEMYHDWPMPRGQVAFQQWTQGRSWSISILRAWPRDSIDGDRQINRTNGLFLLCVYCHVVCNPETEKDRKIKHDQIRLEGGTLQTTTHHQITVCVNTVNPCSIFWRVATPTFIFMCVYV